MKKLFIILFCCLISFSCTDKIDFNQLRGDWKLNDVIDKTNLKASDKTIFYENNSFSCEIFTNGKSFSKITGKYKIDTINSTITTYYNGNKVSHFKIIKLTPKDLEMRDYKTKKIIRYIRP